MILVDGWGHMTATGGREELHSFAREIGLSRASFRERNRLTGGPLRRPYYVIGGRRERAIRKGARLVNPRVLVAATRGLRE
jgi:hypothetical protein